MKSPDQSKILVIDGGQFFSLAQRLRGHFSEVYFASVQNPCYPVPAADFIGNGFDKITQLQDFSRVLDQIDVVAVPDVGLGWLQKMLSDLNIPVWGSQSGSQLEEDRLLLKKLEKELGLYVPDYQVIQGLDRLIDLLKNHGECFVKVSKYRGLTETHHFTDLATSQTWLDKLALDLGALQHVFEFLVEEPLETEIETGIDTYFVNQFPMEVIHAVEAKDKGCLSTVTPWNDLPPQVQEIGEKLTPWLKAHDYQNFLSLEVRITPDGKGFLTDITTRLATPCGEPMLKLIKNLPEIILHGSEGLFVKPDYANPFAAQALLAHGDEDKHWRYYEIPKSHQEDVFLYNPIQLDDELFGTPPLHYSSELIGNVVACDDNIKDCVLKIKQVANELPKLTVKLEGIQEALKVAAEMEEEGVPFTAEPIPKPELAINQG